MVSEDMVKVLVDHKVENNSNAGIEKNGMFSCIYNNNTVFV